MSQCEVHDCEKEAVYRCYWPGQTIINCPEHKEKTVSVAAAMGFDLATEFVDQAAYDSVSTGGSHRSVEDE